MAIDQGKTNEIASGSASAQRILDAFNPTKFGVGASTPVGSGAALTAVDASAFTAADATVIDATYGTVEEDVLNNVRTRTDESVTVLTNVRTRLNDLEARLQAAGIIL